MKKLPEGYVPQFTAQAAINLFHDYETAVQKGESKTVEPIRSFYVQSRNAELFEIDLALTGMIESTRTDEVDAEGKKKRKDTEESRMARKFASYVRSVIGAVRFAGLKPEILDQAPSANWLYEETRKALEKTGVKTDGRKVEEVERDKEKRAIKKAAEKVAEESGKEVDLLNMSDTERAEFIAKVKEQRNKDKLADNLKKMETRSKGIVRSLLKEWENDIEAVESVLKQALELIGSGEWQSLKATEGQAA